MQGEVTYELLLGVKGLIVMAHSALNDPLMNYSEMSALQFSYTGSSGKMAVTHDDCHRGVHISGDCDPTDWTKIHL